MLFGLVTKICLKLKFVYNFIGWWYLVVFKPVTFLNGTTQGHILQGYILGITQSINQSNKDTWNACN